MSEFVTPQWFHPPVWRAVLRPDGTMLWLPRELAKTLALKRGQRLTLEIFRGRAIQGLLAERRQCGNGRAETGKEEGRSAMKGGLL